MKRCPRPGCNLAGTSVGDCGGFHGCPRPREIDHVKDVTIKCVPCKRTWSIPISDVVKGKGSALNTSCPSANCKAVIINSRPKREKAKKAKAVELTDFQ